MSSLTALKLQRELEITRRAMAGATEPPRPVMQWRVDPRSNRPVGVWTVPGETAAPTVMPEPGFV